MMKHAAVVLTLSLSVAPVMVADDAEIVKGLQNLSNVYRIANVLELRRTLAHSLPVQVPIDPWGTKYRVNETPVGYRIVSAGSDAKFEETVALSRQQFTGLEGDVVFEDGHVIRSNRNWLYSQTAKTGPAADALKELDQTEIDFVMMRAPIMQSLVGAKATVNTMKAAGVYVQEKKVAPPVEFSYDAWGTPFRVTINEDGTYRIVSAAADRTFDETSWTRPANPDFAEDFIFENGTLIRYVNQESALKAANLAGSAVPQPPDATLFGQGRWVRIEPPIVAPVVETRVEPAYPDDYRRARIAGLVILEAAISETGAVEHVGVLKSLGPGLDMSAVNAVRQWKFKPATKDGKPVAVLFNLTINFKLK